MSVLIEGMQMPEKCGLCDLFHAESPMHCTVVKGHKTVGAPYGMPRPDWCPLVEVPTPVSDLIDRQAAIDAVMELIEAGYEWRSGVSRKISLLNAVYCALEDIPSAQPTAEPVKHGKWIREVRYTIDSLHSYQQYRCSECGMTYITNTKYCPNCGAYMKGNEDD